MELHFDLVEFIKAEVEKQVNEKTKTILSGCIAQNFDSIIGKQFEGKPNKEQLLKVCEKNKQRIIDEQVKKLLTF